MFKHQNAAVKHFEKNIQYFALIRSVVRSASANDISVLGIRRGYSGLINGDIIEMGARSVDGIIRKGGTMLYTARCKEMTALNDEPPGTASIGLPPLKMMSKQSAQSSK